MSSSEDDDVVVLRESSTGNMSIVRIGGADDPRVSAYHAVRDAELVRERGVFVAEGRLVVERLIEDRRFAVQSLLLSESALRAIEPTLAALPPGVPVYVCAAGDLLGVTGYDVHRGCLALAARPAARSIDSLLQHARTLVVLDGVTNADNVGGVFRNAAAFAVDAVLLDASSCDPLYRKAIRTSMAATLRVPFAKLAGPASAWAIGLAGLKDRGFTLVALTPAASARDLDEFAASGRSDKLALLLGSESHGLSAASLAIADHRVRIPISPAVNSLNLAVAAGIALHRFSG
jgi:tRNA G18 (ribose-2'-O)-methylase SpoU